MLISHAYAPAWSRPTSSTPPPPCLPYETLGDGRRAVKQGQEKSVRGKKDKTECPPKKGHKRANPLTHIRKKKALERTINSKTTKNKSTRHLCGPASHLPRQVPGEESPPGGRPARRPRQGDLHTSPALPQGAACQQVQVQGTGYSRAHLWIRSLCRRGMSWRNSRFYR